jgi:hypothetical protein
MKSIRSLLLAGVAALLSVVPLALVAANVTISPAAETLYVRIDSPDLIAFRHYRLAKADGSELILSTLKKTAAEQARFAGYTGEVIVLDDGAEAPAGADVLLLEWNDELVNASLHRGGKKKFLSTVSRAPLSGHPNFPAMRADLDRGSRDERRDADLRAKTQMYLYESLRLARRQEK